MSGLAGSIEQTWNYKPEAFTYNCGEEVARAEDDDIGPVTEMVECRQKLVCSLS